MLSNVCEQVEIANMNLNDFTFAVPRLLKPFHHPRPHCCHLRTIVRADDSGHDVAAVSRPNLKKHTGFRLNIKLRAVRSQPCLKPCSNSWEKRTSSSRSASKYYLRL